MQGGDQSQSNQMMSSIYEYLPVLSESMSKTSNGIQESIKQGLSNTFTKLSQIKTNIIYSIKHSNLPFPLLQRKQVQIKNDKSEAVLLGKTYNHNNVDRFQYVFRNILWFTYRKGIKEIDSDNGWGCMIRTVQMVIAETLKRNLNIRTLSQSQQQHVIRHFSQQSDGVLSLSAICKEGSINKRWTSSIQVLTAFQKIMKKHPKYFNFGIEVVASGVVYETVESQLLDSYPTLICLSNRVSLTDIPGELHPHYKSLMRNESWVGTIGGVKGQALYIVGQYDDKVIFLDPHLVQKNQEQMQVWSYCCLTPRSIDLSFLSPSLSFCYYIRNEQQHLEWLSWIDSLNKVYYPHLVFQLMPKQTKQVLLKQYQELDQQKNNQELLEPCQQNSSGDVEIIEEKSGQFVCMESKKKSMPQGKGTISSRKSLEVKDRVIEDEGKPVWPEDSDDSSQFEVLI